MSIIDGCEANRIKEEFKRRLEEQDLRQEAMAEHEAERAKKGLPLPNRLLGGPEVNFGFPKDREDGEKEQDLNMLPKEHPMKGFVEDVVKNSLLEEITAMRAELRKISDEVETIGKFVVKIYNGFSSKGKDQKPVDFSQKRSVADFRKEVDAIEKAAKKAASKTQDGEPKPKLTGERKLIPAQVKLVRLRHRNGWSMTDIAGEFGVSRVTVRNIIKGKTYKDVE